MQTDKDMVCGFLNETNIFQLIHVLGWDCGKMWEFSSINVNGAEKEHQKPPIIIDTINHNLLILITHLWLLNCQPILFYAYFWQFNHT
jgi:hypothetical protein